MSLKDSELARWLAWVQLGLRWWELLSLRQSAAASRFIVYKTSDAQNRPPPVPLLRRSESAWNRELEMDLVRRAEGTSSRLLLCVVAALALSSCQPRATEIQLTAGTASLAQTDPSLIDALGSYIFLAFFNAAADADYSCKALVNRPILDLKGPGMVGIQVTDAVENGGEGSDHTFGQLTPPGPYSFLVLGSTKRRKIDGREIRENYLEKPENADAAVGSVVAIGCVEEDVRLETGLDLDIVLFPAGLR